MRTLNKLNGCYKDSSARKNNQEITQFEQRFFPKYRAHVWCFTNVTSSAAHTVCCRGNSCMLTLRIAKKLFLITANLNVASILHHVQANESMVVHLMKLHSTWQQRTNCHKNARKTNQIMVVSKNPYTSKLMPTFVKIRRLQKLSFCQNLLFSHIPQDIILQCYTITLIYTYF